MNKLFEGVKCVFFDAGYTLVNEDAAWRERCRAQAETDEGRALRWSAGDVLREIAPASAQMLPQYRAVIEKFHIERPVPYQSAYETLYEDALPALTALRPRYKLGIIANQQAGLETRLKKWGAAAYMDVVVSSFEAGVSKPDPAIFRLALQKAGCEPAKALMAGDRPGNDILPKRLACAPCASDAALRPHRSRLTHDMRRTAKYHRWPNWFSGCCKTFCDSLIKRYASAY